MNALPVLIAIYVLVIGFIVVARIVTKEKSSIEQYWTMFVGLTACSTPILLGFLFAGYVGAVIGLGITLFILRQIISSSSNS